MRIIKQWKEQQLQKNKVIDSIQGIVSTDTKVGSVILNHNNSLKHKTTKSKYSLMCEGGFINV